MKKCSDNCTPCCDFCIHAYHEYFEDAKEGYLNGYIRGGPTGCIIHYDEAHQKTAQLCGWCEDFYCFRRFLRDNKKYFTLREVCEIAGITAEDLLNAETPEIE